MDTAERTSVKKASQFYDGFISYSHAADDLLAPRLQSGLQRFAKPWWKRRALRIFRDESSLSANPHLWSSITEALDQSGWFVLLLSPDAASSEWVNQEIEYWKEHKDPSRILPVLTDGTFEWTDGDVSGTAAPEQLQGTFSEEPRWVDMRFARDETDLDLKDPRFADAVADIASALRSVPKDELASEEVKQHRRTIRTAWAAAALVGLLAIAATIFGIQSANNAQEAERQSAIASQEAERANQEAERAEANAAAESEARQLAQARELSASAIGVLPRDPELATLLALHAITSTPEGVDQPIEVINALWQASSQNRLIQTIETDYESVHSLSPDGSQLVFTVATNELRAIDLETGQEIWTYSEETSDVFTFTDISADGRLALSILDSTSGAVREVVESPDDMPNRLVILDSSTGEHLHTIEYPECLGAEIPAWSPDGDLLALSSGFDGCERKGSVNWIEVLDTTNWDQVAFLPVEGDNEGPVARWDADGKLYALRPFSANLVFSGDTFQTRTPLKSSGMGDVSDDGSTLVTSFTDGGSDLNVHVFDVENGEQLDILPGTSNPSLPNGVLVSPDGQIAVVGTSGSFTSVYDLTSGLKLFDLPTGEIFSLALHPHLDRLFTAGGQGVQIWDLGDSSVGVETTGDLGTFSWVNGNSFRVGTTSAAMDTIDFTDDFRWAIQVFDPKTGVPAGEPMVDRAGPAWLANGKLLAVDFDIGRQVLIDPDSGDEVELDACVESASDENGELVCVGQGEPAFYNIVASHDGTELLGIGYEDRLNLSGHLAILDPKTGEVIERTESPRFPQTLVTGKWAAGRRGFRGSAVVDRRTGEVLYSATPSDHFETSPTESLLAVVRRQTDLVMIDTETWTERFIVSGSGRIRGVGFNADESRIAVGDTDSLYVVDVGTGKVVQQMRLPGVSDILWIDEDTVLVGTNNGLFGMLSLATDEFLDRTRSSLRRTFTDQECATYRIDPCPSLEEMRGS